jgi:hypothetical protein
MQQMGAFEAVQAALQVQGSHSLLLRAQLSLHLYIEVYPAAEAC